MTDALPNAIERGTDICCPHCDAHTPRTRYAGLAGTTVNCESCDRAFIVPDPGPTPLVDDEHSQSGKRFARKPTPWMMLRRAAGSLIGTRLGQVDIVGILGRGGMGTVYVGRHADLDIDVAVKALPEETAADEQLIQRFLREARLAIRLNHPNVVSIYNVGQQDGLYYIVMELVRGSDAAHMMKEGGRFSFRRAIEIGIAATHALEAAHAEGLVHRDMKPHNILISTDGRVKISDFGLARAAAGQSGLTVSGQVMGTPHYMSPEQAETLPIDHRSDIYSLGITLYHMLTGHPPFQGDTPIAVALAHVRRDVPFPADVFSHFPDPLVAVLKRMCAKKPENRFSSAAEVRAALESLLTAAAPETGSDALLPALISEPKAISSREQEIQETVRASRTGSFYGIDRGWSARGNRVVIARRLGKALLLLAMVAGFAGGALFLYREITSDRPGRFSSNNPPATSGGIFSPSSPRNGAPAPLEKLFKDAESLLEGDITATSLDEARATLKAVEALDPSGADAERYLALSLRLESQQFRYGIARKLDEIRSSIAANDLPTAAQSLAAATVLAARAPEALRESAQREIEAARSEALAASDSAFNASLAEARSAVTLGQYSRARSILSNVMPDFLNDGQKAELTAAIATAEQARRDRFDALEAGITKALASSNLDHAHNLLEDAAKLELNENEQQRLAKLQAQVPGRQRTLEASRRLNEAWQAIAASELERAQYKLNGVDENLDHDIAARKSLAEQALVKALVFESAIRQLDIILAHEALMSL
ncbi:MAG: protein kinase, partial [Planctomycetes bacterium]|nr:protein kinase [Planctomycetota bacterium]